MSPASYSSSHTSLDEHRRRHFTLNGNIKETTDIYCEYFITLHYHKKCNKFNIKRCHITDTVCLQRHARTLDYFKLNLKYTNRKKLIDGAKF